MGRQQKNAILQGMLQLNSKNVFRAFNAKDLSDPKVTKVLSKVLNTISLIKEKQDGRLKGHICTDGRPQRDLYKKSETTLPTMSTTKLLTTIAINAKKGQDVATADIASTHLNPQTCLMSSCKLMGI